MEYVDGEDLGVAAPPHRTAARGQGARDRAPDLRRPGGRARARRPASRSEAGQHHARRARARCASRTSAWPAIAGRSKATISARHAGLHGARAARRARSHGAQRHLRARPGALRDLHRQAAVRTRRRSPIWCAHAPRPAGESVDIAGVAISTPVIERIILRCLDPEPSRRPASALAVAAALPGGDPLAARSPRAKPRRRKWSRRRVKARGWRRASP